MKLQEMLDRLDAEEVSREPLGEGLWAVKIKKRGGNMQKFENGSRVIVVGDCEEFIPVGFKGTVEGYVFDGKRWYAVEFERDLEDTPYGHHDCDGFVSSNNGLWIREDKLKLVD